MVDGKTGESWNHTATLLALLYNINSPKKKTTPEDWKPGGRPLKPLIFSLREMIKANRSEDL